MVKRRLYRSLRTVLKCIISAEGRQTEEQEPSERPLVQFRRNPSRHTKYNVLYSNYFSYLYITSFELVVPYR